MKLRVHDIAAGLVACVATLGVILLGLEEKPIPPELSGLLGAMAGWLFRGVVAGVNGHGGKA